MAGPSETSEQPTDLTNLDATIKMPAIQTAETATAAATQLIQMPVLGLYGLAQELYPGDRGDEKALQQHVADLFEINRDLLRTDTSFIVHQLVRVPVVSE